MEKIVIFNANNESMQVEVVRYFGEGNNKYFIFSLHEVDAQGHMNIYVTKTVEQNGTMIGTNIIDDVEWTNLKTTLQRIIKENRASGNAVVNDLPYANLSNMRVMDRRALKLLAASVDMLNLGYNASENNGGQQNVVDFAQPNVQNQIVDTVDPQPVVQNIVPDSVIQPQPMQNIVPNQGMQQQTMQNIAPNQEIQPQPMQAMMPNPEQQPAQNNTQNVPIQPQASQNELGIFNMPVQNIPNQVPNNNQNYNANQNINQQPVQNPVDNSIAENYKDLYFQEKENTSRLMQENSNLINELNNYKLMISDIKNILSR